MESNETQTIENPAPQPPPAAASVRPPDYARPFFWALLLCLALGVAQFMLGKPLLHKPVKADEEGGDLWSALGHFGPSIAVVKVYGEIKLPDRETYYGSESAQDIVDTLHKLRKRDDIKGVVLRVNSPGGTVAASQEIYAELLTLSKQHQKKIVVSMGDMAASGGYYISAPADFIYANSGTITGSIGVITQAMGAKELIDKIGIQLNTFKSGAFKDMGNPARQVTTEEVAIFNSIVMDAYDQFVKAVSTGRVLTKETNGRKPVLKSEEEVRKLADGRIYTGAQAVANGLADAEGTLWDAIQKCGELAGLGKEPHVANIRSLPPLPDFGRFLRTDGSSSGDALSRIADRVSARVPAPVMYLYQP